MAISLQLGFPDVPKSITNPNVDKKNAIDVGYPMSFLNFIKNINISLDPKTLQSYYSHYVSIWNKGNSNSKLSDKNIIIERYKDFLKDIILKYSTLEEKKFLSKIDFNDPLDLDVALNFYSKKLIELCDFYNKKRTDIKFGIIQNKIKGSNLGTEQTIKNLTISYIKNVDDSKMLFDIDSIISKLEVEIEELYDTYPFYLNQEPDERIYDNKDLDYNLNIFLKNDEELISEVFSGLSDEIKKIKEVDQLFENKRNLTKKYTSTDFYFLSTGSTTTDFISGKLFENNNTILNFLNRNYPTTSSTDRHINKTPREQGFFRPSNISLILIDGIKESFSYNFDALEPNSLYFFPDPSIISNNTGIIRVTIDDSYFKKNQTHGVAINQPSSNNLDTKYYGYVSKVSPEFEKDLDSIFNSGYIQDFKQDLYGNSYGLFKSGFQKYIQTEENSSLIVNLIFNGHQFYDNFYGEGYNFNYYTEDTTTFNETIRTGLSSYTYNFTNFDSDFKLVFGKFKPYYALIKPTDDNLVVKNRYIEGALFTTYNNMSVLDPVSSDLSIFTSTTSDFYYSKLIEGGITNNSPQSRALLDPTYPSLSAKFINYNRLSTIELNGGSFGDVVSYFNVTNNNVYIDSNINNTEVLPLSIFDQYNGYIFIKNKNTNKILPLLDSLPHLITTYPIEILDQLNNINKFEMVYDVISIETDNYIIFEKIKYDNSKFISSKLPIVYNEHSTNPFKKLSNRIKVKSDIFYFILDYEGNFYDKTLKVYPNIYKFDCLTHKNQKIYPTSTISNYFSLSSNNIQYNLASSPIISYSSRNNIFNISFLLKDQNNFPLLQSYDMNIGGSNVEILNKREIILSDINISNIFYNNIPSNLNVFVSNTPTTFNNDILLV